MALLAYLKRDPKADISKLLKADISKLL